jgi:hypothetical protein
MCKRPDRNTVSFMCEFKKQDLLSNLNAPAANFKEITPGTQYWSRVSVDKVPKNVPNQVYLVLVGILFLFYI